MKIYKRKENKRTIAGAVYHLLYYDKNFVKILYNLLFICAFLLAAFFIYTRFILLVIIALLLLWKIIPGYYSFLKMQKQGLFNDKTLYGEMSKFLFGRFGGF